MSQDKRKGEIRIAHAKQSGVPVKCECGKIVAYQRGGKIYIFCKSCKRQFEIEPRA